MKKCPTCPKEIEDKDTLCPDCRSKLMQEMGRKGGNTTKERHGVEHYSRIGKLGGKRVKEAFDRLNEGMK